MVCSGYILCEVDNVVYIIVTAAIRVCLFQSQGTYFVLILYRAIAARVLLDYVTHTKIITLSSGTKIINPKSARKS
jgi:hypothetical protein